MTDANPFTRQETEFMTKTTTTTKLDPRRPELLNCYCWNCPECGAQNFAFSEPLELTPDEKREHISEAEGIPLDCLNVEDDELNAVRFDSSPQFIECSNCELRFEAAAFEEWKLPVAGNVSDCQFD